MQRRQWRGEKMVGSIKKKGYGNKVKNHAPQYDWESVYINDNEEVFYTLQTSRNGASPPDTV